MLSELEEALRRAKIVLRCVAGKGYCTKEWAADQAEWALTTIYAAERALDESRDYDIRSLPNGSW
jgi:hypothetical protein